MVPNNPKFKRCEIGDLQVGIDYLTYEREPLSGTLRNFVMRCTGSASNKDEFRKAEFIFEIPDEAELVTMLNLDNTVTETRLVQFVGRQDMVNGQRYVVYMKDGGVSFIMHNAADVVEFPTEIAAIMHVPEPDDLAYPHVLVNEPHEEANVGYMVDTRDGSLVKGIPVVHMGGYGTHAPATKVDRTAMGMCISSTKLQNILNALKDASLGR